jgi:hypothetical protein
MGSWARRLAAAAAATGLVLGSLTTQVIPAFADRSASSGTVNNPYSPAYGHPYRHGVVPTVARGRQMQAYAQAHRSTTTTTTGPETLAYGGGIDGIGVTSGTPKVYLVFWGSQWGTQTTNSSGNLTFSHDPSGGAPYIQNLFKGLGTGNELWSGTMTQYCDGSVAAGATSCPSGAHHIAYPTGGALAGVWYDNSTSEPAAASGHQIGQEAVKAAAHFGNTTSAYNRYAQYDILSPTGLNPDNWLNDGFCAWHDYNGDTTLTGGAVSSTYGDIAFTNMPYVMDAGSSCGQGFVNSPGTLDGYSIVNGHEYAETVTDQNPAGGWTNHHFNSYGGEENGDECAWISSGQGASANVSMGTGTFAMQSTWSNDTNRCDISHPIVGATTSNDFSISASPASQSVTQGSSTTYTVSTALTSGSAQSVSLSATGLPSGATASFNPTSVTAGGSSTLTVSTASSTPTGTNTITIQGTATSGSHSTTVSLTVNAPLSNDFSISSNPSSLSIAQGGSGSSTISTAVITGSAQTVSLSAGVSPSGPTAALSPTSVTAGGSSTVTVSVGSSVAPGPYTVTVTGTEGSATHTTTVSVNVTSVGGSGLTNGGFEAGSLTGWTASGASTGISTTAHSGTYSARLGSTSATNGDSAVAQTFTVPSGDGTLSFWYQLHCPDTVTYDWATATLKDNSSGTTVTMLPRTCVTSTPWTQVSGSVTAGHSYTLTLLSHDDNYAGDPTYTLYDDVALGAAAPPPSAGITNGGFETGSLNGWTASGAATGMSTTAHSGSYSALLGSASATNGDSTIAQTFSAPSGTSRLSLWYQVHCQDTVTYDWARVALKDNTAGTTTTVLARTCTNNNTWMQVSATVTAGHSYTLTLVSHDDNYPGDPTYTLYDDVVLQ